MAYLIEYAPDLRLLITHSSMPKSTPGVCSGENGVGV